MIIAAAKRKDIVRLVDYEASHNFYGVVLLGLPCDSHLFASVASSPLTESRLGFILPPSLCI